MKSGLAIMVLSAGILAAGPAMSQSPWPQAQPQQQAPSAWPQQQQQQQAPSAWPQQQQAAPAPAGPSPWDQPAQAPQQSGPDPWSQRPQAQAPQADTRCLEQFKALREDVEKRGGMIQAAGQRKEKPTPKEACNLFNNFTAAERKMLTYATKNQASCGIPQQIIDNIKQGRVKSDEVRNRVCQIAAQGPAPQQRPPSLSDALTAPVPDSGNIRTGGGTFDTLTGNPLAK